MKQLASNIRRYGKLLTVIFKIALQQAMAYRLNFAVQSIHATTYIVTLFLAVLVLYSKTTSLGGWSLDEILLLFGVAQVTFCVHGFAYMHGAERFMSQRIRHGDFDFDLIKPASPLFLALFREPWLDAVLLFSAASTLVVVQVVKLWHIFTPLSILGGLTALLLSWLILYFIYTAYTSLAFHVTKAVQVIFFLEKISDYSHYPVTIFPNWFKLVAFSFVPTVLFGFISISILLHKASLQLWLFLIISLPLAALLQRWAWRTGLKHYSSASS